MLTIGQLSLLIATMGAFALALVSAIARRPADAAGPVPARSRRRFADTCIQVGAGLCLLLIAWHAMRRRVWLPLDDNFGSFLCLGALLALFLAYVQRVHPLRGLDFFVLPVVLLLLTLAAVFGQTRPHDYQETAWSILHRVTAYGGFVAFAIAGAAGLMYLFANHRLRHKKLPPGDGFGSLERLEHWTRVAVTLGFALLTVGLVSGLFRILYGGTNSLGPQWYRSPKVILTFVAWVVYALVLHAPINPAFRGRRTAMLSVVGFVIMIGTFVAVQFMPGGRTP